MRHCQFGLVALSRTFPSTGALASALHVETSAAQATDAEAIEAGATEAVQAVLQQYKQALEALDASPTARLFTEDSQIFETGGAEGSYAEYLVHHLGPELTHFTAFRFSDYAVDVRFEGPVAIASATYNYTIEIEGRDPIERQGVATSVLIPVDGEWRIVQMHNSGRPLRRPEE